MRLLQRVGRRTASQAHTHHQATTAVGAMGTRADARAGTVRSGAGSDLDQSDQAAPVAVGVEPARAKSLQSAGLEVAGADVPTPGGDRRGVDSARKSLVGERLRALRAAQAPHGWTQDRLVHELEQVARRTGLPAPSKGSSKVQVSRWENGHTYPDARNRELLRTALGATDEDLGFSNSLAAGAGRALVDAERAEIAVKVEELRAYIEEMTSATQQRLNQVLVAVSTTARHLAESSAADESDDGWDL